MTKWRAVQIALALALVAAVSLSSVWVTQASSENKAHSQLSQARSAAQAALRHAHTVGLLSSETAGLAQRERKLDSASAPVALPFWRAGVTQFYHRQTAQYLRLTAAVRAQVRAVTGQTRHEAQSALDRLTAEMRTADGLDLDTHSVHALQQQQAASMTAGVSTPARFRTIVSKVSPATDQLTAAVKARQTYVASVVAAAHNDVNQVWSTADAERDAASNQAWLIGLLNRRGAAYTAQLTSASAAVHAQQTASAAAVKEASIHDLSATIAADFKRTIPAKMIVVSTEDQSARLFESGTEIYSTPVTTGGPELPTDHGVFHIYMKASPFTFHSPWPLGSPYYYPPTDVQFWMPFYGGEGLHDASWRSNFGPGSNFAPTDLGTGVTIMGTHGCVNLPYDAASYIWNWAPIGTTVVVT